MPQPLRYRSFAPLFVFAMGCLCLMGLAGQASADSWKLTNPGKVVYEHELVRLDLPVPAGDFTVTEDGTSVPFQVETGPDRAWIWVMTDLPAAGTKTYATAPGKPAAGAGAIKVTTTPTAVQLQSDLLSLTLPGSSEKPSDVPTPVMKLQGQGNAFGTARWHTALAATRVTTTVLGQGPLFAKARVRFDFDGRGGTLDEEPAFYELTVTLAAHHPYAMIHESMAMPAGDGWELDLAAGWKPTTVAVQLNNGGSGAGAGASFPRENWPTTLAPGQTRMGQTLVNLLPRWSQSFDDGWFFGTTDGTQMAGVIPARASQWVWPHENKIVVKVKPSADYAGLQLPTHRGSRTWMLVLGPANLIGQERDLVGSAAMWNLDKIIHEYIHDWPVPAGQPAKKGGFSPAFFYDSSTNPTSVRRQQGRNAIKDALAGKQGDLSTLFAAQQSLDPDWYGTYDNFWSPENPNFFTDFHKVSMGLVAQLRDHPQFEVLRSKAEAVFRSDVDHSVTLPGGAGQECPGYLSHAITQWREMLPVCQKYLKFDPSTWPRWKAAGQFIAQTSQPMGDGKRDFHPGGDTHPGRPEPLGFAATYGYQADVRKFTTQEIPGFGAVFRNKPGTDTETYFAFKAGPNRGHYHGDQLSFHYADHARSVAVDHHCSYHPRAGQEHMHNRVAFSDDTFEYANIDGYERLIAFKTAPAADIAIGQVSSNRMRRVTALPPEDWDSRLPQRTFPAGQEIVYRRTVVMVRGDAASGGQDYFVLRDQSWQPEDVTATWGIHVLGDKAEQDGSVIHCNGLDVFVASPVKYTFKTLSWEHENGGLEKTTGPRLSVKGSAVQFITVLYPTRQGKPPAMKAIDGGVQVGEDRITFSEGLGRDGQLPQQERLPLVSVERAGKSIATVQPSDVDFDRNQGHIGLFVPDAGYAFGDIPDWLIQQRRKIKD